MIKPSGWLRVGGRFELAGSVSTWSVAEGRQGRRWRTVTLDRAGTLRAMLLEVGTDGRPARLELATPRGLLTVHPEAEPPALHGNVVGESGVRPISLPWSVDHLLAVEDEPLCVVIAVHGRLRDARRQLEVPVVIVDAALSIEARRWQIDRVSAAEWRITPAGSAGDALRIELDEDGLPRAIDGVAIDAARWSLEEL